MKQHIICLLTALSFMFIAGCESDYNKIEDEWRMAAIINREFLSRYRTNDLKIVIESLYNTLYEYHQLEKTHNLWFDYEEIYGIHTCRLGFAYEKLGNKIIAEEYFNEALQHFSNSSNECITNIVQMTNAVHNFDSLWNPLWIQ